MQINRRQFLTTTMAGAAGLALSGRLPAADQNAVNPFEIVPLNKTGIKTSRIGIGTGMRGGNRQSNHTRMGKEKFNALIDGAWERGIRFFDTADLYGTMPYLAEALKGKPRDQYVICSKIWVMGGGIPEAERPDANIVIDRFRKELNTDYIDLVLIHCMTDKAWTDKQKKQMDIMAECKSRGIIKAHGVSLHSLPALKLCATTPWVDSVHVRLNPFGMSMDAKPEEVAPVVKQIHDAGKGVVAMKLMGEGRLKDDERKTRSVEYVMGLGCVDVMIVGFEEVAQIDDFSGRVRKCLLAKANA
jgi:aryl-alcohol dehydrogenase-like predicted oxidoreductase